MSTKRYIRMTVFPALMVATLGISIPLTGAPITLQTLFVLLAGLYLGKVDGAISMLLYILLGIVGLPVFAGFQGGFGVLLGPTGGFILSFVVSAYLTGYIYEHTNNLIYAVVAGSLLIYAIGIPWMSTILGWPLFTTLSYMTIYFPGDIIKGITAILLLKRLNTAR